MSSLENSNENTEKLHATRSVRKKCKGKKRRPCTEKYLMLPVDIPGLDIQDDQDITVLLEVGVSGSVCTDLFLDCPTSEDSAVEVTMISSSRLVEKDETEIAARKTSSDMVAGDGSKGKNQIFTNKKFETYNNTGDTPDVPASRLCKSEDTQRSTFGCLAKQNFKDKFNKVMEEFHELISKIASRDHEKEIAKMEKELQKQFQNNARNERRFKNESGKSRHTLLLITDLTDDFDHDTSKFCLKLHAFLELAKRKERKLRQLKRLNPRTANHKSRCSCGKRGSRNYFTSCSDCWEQVKPRCAEKIPDKEVDGAGSEREHSKTTVDAYECLAQSKKLGVADFRSTKESQQDCHQEESATMNKGQHYNCQKESSKEAGDLDNFLQQPTKLKQQQKTISSEDNTEIVTTQTELHNSTENHFTVLTPEAMKSSDNSGNKMLYETASTIVNKGGIGAEGETISTKSHSLVEAKNTVVDPEPRKVSGKASSLVSALQNSRNLKFRGISVHNTKSADVKNFNLENVSEILMHRLRQNVLVPERDLDDRNSNQDSGAENETQNGGELQNAIEENYFDRLEEQSIVKCGLRDIINCHTEMEQCNEKQEVTYECMKAAIIPCGDMKNEEPIPREGRNTFHSYSGSKHVDYIVNMAEITTIAAGTLNPEHDCNVGEADDSKTEVTQLVSQPCSKVNDLGFCMNNAQFTGTSYLSGGDVHSAQEGRVCCMEENAKTAECQREKPSNEYSREIDSLVKCVDRDSPHTGMELSPLRNISNSSRSPRPCNTDIIGKFSESRREKENPAPATEPKNEPQMSTTSPEVTEGIVEEELGDMDGGTSAEEISLRSSGPSANLRRKAASGQPLAGSDVAEDRLSESSRSSTDVWSVSLAGSVLSATEEDLSPATPRPPARRSRSAISRQRRSSSQVVVTASELARAIRDNDVRFVLADGSRSCEDCIMRQVARRLLYLLARNDINLKVENKFVLRTPGPNTKMSGEKPLYASA